MTGPRLPPRLKVGHKVYAIVEWPHAEARASQRMGESDRLNNVIRIQLHERPPGDAAETLLHEILHCAYYLMGVEKGDEEERVVRAFGDGLAAIWADNPEVFAWIAARLRRP